ncbi:MAG: T9SS type B sorting domain-containing protein [Crocinitomix sp.]|nr:T9SS type B sorting domain-containing protein [Crocinitomix sp.]
MKKSINVFHPFGFVLAFLCGFTNVSIAQTETFTYTGAVQTYTVPAGVTLIEIEAWGAQGGSAFTIYDEFAPGGLGGYAKGDLVVIPGQILNVYVGGGGGAHGAGGFNGGGQAGSEYGAAGGGGSDVRTGLYGLSDRIIVGGGGGGCSFGVYSRFGGYGGGLIGGVGAFGAGNVAGTGGTQVAGGDAGCCFGIVSAGSFGLGGGTGDYRNAGGGGGWYGGGSGSGSSGGCGGSSYIDGLTDATTSGNIRSGNGLVNISVACDALTATASTLELCEDEELTLEAVSDNGGDISWDGGATNGVPFIPGSTGVITYTGTSDEGEDCWVFVEIEVFELPEVVADVDLIEICHGDAVVFSEIGDADTYTWDPVDVLSGDPYFPEVGTETYTLTGVNDATGCQNSSEIEVTVNALPIISAGEDLAICVGSEVTLSGTGLEIDGVYNWGGGVTNDVAFGPLVTNSYILTGTNANDCENKDTVLVTVHDLPLIEAGLGDSVCYGDMVTLSAEGLVDPEGYSWSDGVINETPFIPELTQYYFLEGIDDNGCENTDSVLVVVHSLPLIYGGEDQSICNGDGLILSGTGAGADGVYNWTEGVVDDIEFIPVATTTYIVTGTDAIGCDNTDTVTIEIYSLPPVDAGDDQDVCFGDEVVLSASGAGPDAIYTWEDGIVNDIAFEATSSNTYIVLGVDENGCENSDTVVIVVNPLPIINAGSDLVICAEEEVVLNGNGAGVDGLYTWNNGLLNGASFIPENSDEFILIGVDANGCESSDTIAITLLVLPEIDGGLDQRICIENEVVLMVVNKNEAFDYSWDNGVEDGVPFIVYIENETVYTVTAVNADGCENSDEVQVEVINCDTILVFPTGFSPNNDGVNDYLVFTGIDYDLQKYVAIYNEWGMKLFESYDYKNDWDGTNHLGTSIEKNRALPAGTYYYILEYGENNVVKNYLYIDR